MKRRKLLTVLLAVVLTLALLPAPALAASPGGAAPAAGEVCEIVGGAQFTSLEDALLVVVSGQTIRLLADITTSADFEVDSGYQFTIDTNGKLLIFGADFDVDNGSDVTIVGNAGSNGVVNVSSYDNAKLTITGNFTATSTDEIPVLDCWDGELHIGGNVVGTGIHAGWNGAATVAGNITAGGYGVDCDDGSVEVGNINVTVFNGTAYGVHCSSGTVTVTGNITVDGESGAVGVFGMGSADVTVTGNVTVTSSGTDAVGVQSEPDNVLITVMGNVSVSGAWSTGVLDDGYGEVYIKGNVTATGADSTGAHALSPDGFITVDGTITADGDRIRLDTEVFDMDADSDKAGYDQYSNSSSGGSAYVWVKIPTPPVVVTPPEVTPSAVTPTLPAVTPPVTTPEPQPLAPKPPKEKVKKPSVVKYKVTFNANGGKIGRAKSKSVKITNGKSLGKLPKVANRSNYTFKGWYTSKAGGKKVTAGTKVTKNTTVYAHWQRKALYGKVVKTSALYVRIYPSLHVNLIPTIGYLKGGTVFHIAGFINNPGTGNDWYKLKYKGKVRYLFAKYVKTFYK